VILFPLKWFVAVADDDKLDTLIKSNVVCCFLLASYRCLRRKDTEIPFDRW
jgi:hypothetical protein